MDWETFNIADIIMFSNFWQQILCFFCVQILLKENCYDFYSRKRRHVISDAILNDIKEKSAKRDDEIFGAKSKQQYRPKHTVKGQ